MTDEPVFELMKGETYITIPAAGNPSAGLTNLIRIIPPPVLK
jgi:hypothetical protein